MKSVDTLNLSDTSNSAGNADPAILQIVQSLAKRIGVTGVIKLESIKGGNNRLYRFIAEGKSYIVKHYFRHQGDTRNRLTSEWQFANFLWENSIRCIAQPLACDNENSVALYACIEGEKISDFSEAGQNGIQAAVAFVKDINHIKNSARAQALPQASEAAFSMNDHCRIIQERVTRLQALESTDSISEQAAQFVKKNLTPTWDILRSRFTDTCHRVHIIPNTSLALSRRILSPSDFGFHNVLRSLENKFFFIDFEYSGWDDPAKMVCDFFCQVAVPVPMDYLPQFISAIPNTEEEQQELSIKAEVLLPLYQIKWCCIVLNHFMPVDQLRKAFADTPSNQQKQQQLDKAQEIFSNIKKGL